MQLASKCPKCENTAFETVVETPQKANFKLIFVRCTSCRTVVGVLDYYNIGTLIKDLARKLGASLD